MTGRGTCMAPYNCMVNCMALLLYGAPMRHRHTPLPHAETELSDIHSHANARVCLEVCLGFIEAAAARSIGAFGGASVP